MRIQRHRRFFRRDSKNVEKLYESRISKSVTEEDPTEAMEDVPQGLSELFLFEMSSIAKRTLYDTAQFR